MGNIDGNMIVPCGESVLYNDWGSNRDVSKKKSEYEGTYIYIVETNEPYFCDSYCKFHPCDEWIFSNHLGLHIL
jgi:hypothetical protein